MQPLEPHRPVSSSIRPVRSMRPPWSRCRRLYVDASCAFVGRGLRESVDAKEMLAYQHSQHSGFAVDAGVCITSAAPSQTRSGSHRWSG
jgi:hypothetical protein